MIYLIHGDNLPLAREKAYEIGKKKDYLIKIDLEKNGIFNFLEKIETKNLFSLNRAFLIEHAFNLSSKTFSDFLKKIAGIDLINQDVIFLEDRKLKKQEETKIKDAKIFKFSLPQYYFEFIDSFAPKNKKKLIELLSNITKNQTGEEIFYSLLRRIRLLILLKEENYNHSQMQKLDSWQITKIKQQAKNWNTYDLIRLYNMLFTIEKKMKNGELPLPLNNYIDILVLSL